MLLPDVDGAAQVETALSALHNPSASPSNMSAADSYLRALRTSGESSLNVCAALLADPTAPSPSALLFAASTLAEHATKFPEATALARHALSHPKLPVPCPPVIAALCKAAAWPVVLALITVGAAAPAAEYSILMTVASTHHLECNVHEAIARTITDISTIHPPCHETLRAFCLKEAQNVLSHATRVLLNQSPLNLHAKMDAVSCIRAWIPYQKDVRFLIEPLVFAIATPKLATDVSIVLGEAFEALAACSKPPPDANFLNQYISALRSVYENAQSECIEDGGPGELVCHAVAEVCLCLSEYFVDFLFESKVDPKQTASRCVAGAELTQTLLVCLRAKSHRTFEATLSAWDSWLACMSESPSIVHRFTLSYLPDVVRAILGHLRSVHEAQASHDVLLHYDEDDQMSMRLHNSALDTLHQVSQCMTVRRYLEILLSDSLTDEVTLFALAACGDVSCSSADLDSLIVVLPRIVGVICTNDVSTSPTVRKSAFRALASFAHVLMSPSVDDTCIALALRSACQSLTSLGSEPAMLLQEAADANPRRLATLLPLLIDDAQAALGGNSLLVLRSQQDETRVSQQMNVSEIVARALAHVASELLSPSSRREALSRIIAQQVEYLKAEKNALEHWQRITCDLRIIATAVRGLNDSQIAVSLLDSLTPVVGPLAEQCAFDTEVAPALCSLIESCAAPTLLDPGDEQLRPCAPTAVQEDVAVYCINLASGSFLCSRPQGEGCWLVLLYKLISSSLESSSGPSYYVALSTSFQRVMQGLLEFTSKDGLGSRPDLLNGFLRLLAVLATAEKAQAKDSIRPYADGCGQVALSALGADDMGVRIESLLLWRLLLTTEYSKDIASKALQGIGGASVLCDASVMTACAPSSTRRCTHLAADVILLAHQWSSSSPSLASIPLVAEEKAAVRAALMAAARSGNPSDVINIIADLRRHNPHNRLSDHAMCDMSALQL